MITKYLRRDIDCLNYAFLLYLVVGGIMISTIGVFYNLTMPLTQYDIFISGMDTMFLQMYIIGVVGFIVVGIRNIIMIIGDYV